ncbi:MAG: hypothetical protein Q8L01_02970 [Candidatus Woesebacteria bacterium]|nr:hypothetical protein [Candidatus Woesebacteria bacterium]
MNKNTKNWLICYLLTILTFIIGIYFAFSPDTKDPFSEMFYFIMLASLILNFISFIVLIIRLFKYLLKSNKK